MQFAKNENAPEQSPELIGIGERDAAADADVFCGVLLKEIADDPDESAEDEPEDDAARAVEFLPERSPAGVADGERGHHAEFAEGEKSDEGERVHSGEIGFAIRNVHRAPKNARAERGPNATKRVARGALRGRSDGEQRCANAHDERAAKDASPAAPARLTKFVEEKKAPEDAEEAVGVPEREGDAEADVANRENGERVGDGPEAARENGPDDEVRRATNVGANGGSAEDERGEAPAREKNADDHDERNGDGRNANGDKLRGRFGGAEPG